MGGERKEPVGLTAEEIRVEWQGIAERMEREGTPIGVGITLYGALLRALDRKRRARRRAERGSR